MEKKLPRVFANKIDKSLENNKNVFYSAKVDEMDLRSSDNFITDNQSNEYLDRNVNQKINSIFSSSRYVYKADVDITMKDGKVSKRVIGRNSTHLITIDNELIPITDIIDIDFS